MSIPAERGVRVSGQVELGAEREGALDERLPKPLDDLQHPEIGLEPGEVVLALAPERGLAITSTVSKGGHDVRLLHLSSAKRRALAVGQKKTVAAALSPNGKGAIVLDEEGRVLCYDLATGAYPGSAKVHAPTKIERATIALAEDGRLWLASTGGHIEVRMMHDANAIATVDLSATGDEVTSAVFLPDKRGFLVRTGRGAILRFELLLDQVGSTREARIAAISDVVDAWLGGTSWNRYQPTVTIYEERESSEKRTLFFVADRYEYHHAQSGSDWAEHDLCAGHATFDGARCIEVELTKKDARRLSERDSDSYDLSAERAAFRDAVIRERSSSTEGS